MLLLDIQLMGTGQEWSTNCHTALNAIFNSQRIKQNYKTMKSDKLSFVEGDFTTWSKPLKGLIAIFDSYVSTRTYSSFSGYFGCSADLKKQVHYISQLF